MAELENVPEKGIIIPKKGIEEAGGIQSYQPTTESANSAKIEGKDGRIKIIPASAQKFYSMSKEQRSLLKKEIENNGEDYEEWEEKTKKLFPREVKLPVSRSR